MSTAEHRPRPSSSGAGGVSMRDLLAACAAAKVISTPPVAPPVKGEGRRGVDERRPRAAA
ncbi:hypothetical protein QA995_01965 [Streptomyces scabiei]|nr:hypothetical protein [Streptomyces sp. LBUM 1480]MBP5869329.1 hypothetical protein [Streptomyces sp. LBUM 1485]MBP5914737.1 hypothetical protein [Streptomyces sp. LBUM 1486]MDX3034080.1 hypothetical protein [Streptomyces scabiei]MDX3212718.1 hypothetical protein [Streptomyces scabiei]QTU55844.1 hypothetical protein F3K21_26035 [Streptomyces sp. LBUM 1480]